MALKRKQQTEEPTETLECLTGYTVTRAPGGFGGTGLPPASPASDVFGESAVDAMSARDMFPLHLVEERRDDVRRAIALEVVADHPGRERSLTGVTIDVSGAGMCVRMPEPPSGLHEDLIVTDAFGCAAVWAHVVSHRPAADGGWLWHLKLVAADAQWDLIVDRARDQNAGVVDVADDDHAGAIA